jgi:hypothetical protein
MHSAPESVEVTLGDMVLDPAAGKERDVDVTVKFKESTGIVRAIIGYEVKREKVPLDVKHIEQLSLKLLDMPTVTHRAIVSASGFTDGAKRKASAHGVDLYTIKPWEKVIPGKFPTLSEKGFAPENISIKKILLCWTDETLHLTVTNISEPFNILNKDPVFDAKGNPHKKYQTFGAYRHEILLRSTEILLNLEPAASNLKALITEDSINKLDMQPNDGWRHTHTIDVTKDLVFINVNDSIYQITVITVNGFLHWENSNVPSGAPTYYVMESVVTGEIFSGSIVSAGPREGTMNALILSPTSTTIGVHLISLTEKQRNLIRKLIIDMPI